MNTENEFLELLQTKKTEKMLFRNLEKFKIVDNQVHLWTVMCPLFQQGPIAESQLISDPKSLSESRIFPKWVEFSKFVKEVFGLCEKLALEVDVNIVFADKVAPLIDTNVNVRKALDNHLILWQCEADILGQNLGCRVNRVIPTSSFIKNIPDGFEIDGVKGVTNDVEIFEFINWQIDEWFIGTDQKPVLIVNNSKSRRVIRRLRKVFGFETTVALVLSYIAIDWRFVPLVEKGIKVSMERFDPLHALSKLTPDLDILPRIEITV